MDTYKLTFTIPAQQLFDDETNKFFWTKETTVTICHSLRSIHQWESKWEQSFFTMDGRLSFMDPTKPDPKGVEKFVDYVRCMSLTPNVPDDIFNYLSEDNVNAIFAYIEKKMTATTFGKSAPKKKKPKKKRMTCEEIYAAMFLNGVPLELENWHFNQLMTVIDVMGEKSSPSGKMTPQDRASLNAARRAKHHSKG